MSTFVMDPVRKWQMMLSYIVLELHFSPVLGSENTE